MLDCADGLSLSIVAGNAIRLDVFVTDQRGGKFDFSTDENLVDDIVFSVKRDITSDDVLVVKNLGDGLTLDADDGKISVVLNADDTTDLNGNYVFDFIVEFSDGSAVSVRSDTDMAAGTMTVSPAIASI